MPELRNLLIKIGTVGVMPYGAFLGFMRCPIG